jgi:hypothetical protein
MWARQLCDGHEPETNQTEAKGKLNDIKKEQAPVAG